MKGLLLTIAGCLIIACVEQIDFVAPEEIGVLVVDGEISTLADSNLIRLIRTDRLGRRIYPPEEGARVIVHDDIGGAEVCLETEPGLYVHRAQSVTVAVGRSYYIEIETSDKRKYQSSSESVMLSPTIDELTFEPVIEEDLVDEINLQQKRFFNLNVKTTLPNNSEVYLMWEVDHAFLVSELLCHPWGQPKHCYITREINDNLVLLLDGSQLRQGATISRQVVHQEIDFAFGQAAAFYVTQKALTKEAFAYWADIADLVNNVGSIFDAPPSAIPGNLKSISDPNERVLGYFRAVDAKSKLALVSRGQLGEKFIQNPLCGLPGLAPPQPDPACCNCLRIPNSTIKKPHYWP